MESLCEGLREKHHHRKLLPVQPLQAQGAKFRVQGAKVRTSISAIATCVRAHNKGRAWKELKLCALMQVAMVLMVFFLPPTGADTRLTLRQLALCGGGFGGGGGGGGGSCMCMWRWWL